jgi:hypothetical protein
MFPYIFRNMGIHVEVAQNKTVEVRNCLTSGCVHYYENENEIYVWISDKQKDIKVEKSVKLNKRGNSAYKELINIIFNEKHSLIWQTPKADEGEMIKTLKFAEEMLSHGMKYVGTKLEYVTIRGMKIYFRLRYGETENKPYMTIELIAEKEGEKFVYRVYGDVSDYREMLEEVAKVIATYVEFSNFIHAQTAQQPSS